MKTHRILKFAILAWLTFAPAAFAASFDPVGDDTDLFLVNPNVATSLPNVLIIVDNSVNWEAAFSSVPGSCASSDPRLQVNKKYCHIIAALKSVVGNLVPDVRVGLMMFNESGDNGAYMRFGIRTMSPTNNNALVNLFDNLRASSSASGGDRDNSSGNQPYGRSMFEAFHYFGGYTSPGAASAGSPVDSTHFGPSIFAGGVGSTPADKRDWPGNTAVNPAARPPGTIVNSAARWGAEMVDSLGRPVSAYASKSATNYTSPISDSCQKNFIIFISSGDPNIGGDQGNPKTDVLLQNVGGISALTTINPPNHASLIDEWARFLYATDVSPLTGQQNVITYTISVWDPQANGQPSNSDAAGIELMKSTANQGHGRYYDASDPSKLIDSLASIFAEVQAVNSAFASSSLPVSINVRGTNVNQVYLGMFRPDAFKAPRWPGNLKLYNLALDTTTNSVYLADATNGPPPAMGAAAEDVTTGFVKDSAISFWTASSTYWAFRDAIDNGVGGASDRPDGNLVEKGGVMQQLRQQYPLAEGTTPKRKLYTCTATGCTASGAALSATPFDTTNNDVSQAALGVATATDRTNLINWVRGEDNMDNENKDCTVSPYYPCAGTNNVPRLTDIRAIIHGDVLHSRPAVVNYNRYGSSDNDVYVFYGSNAGIMHAVKGGYATDAGDPGALPPGREAWGFVPPEFFGNLKRLRDNTPKLSSTNKKPYFADGSIGILTQDTNNNLKYGDAGDIVNLYVSMRRGGRFIYALDVNNPLNPRFLWKISNTTSGFSELGQTWSEPRAVTGLVGVTDPVLIFGAGYDAAVEDVQPCLVASASATSVVRKAIGTGTVTYNAEGSCTITNPTGSTTTINRTMGRGVYVVNALTGARIWSAGPAGSGHTLTVPGMDFAIPSDVTIVRNDSGGPVNRAYVGDTGGNIWRIDFSGTNLASSTVTKLAAVGDLTTAAGRRKFLYGPDVMPTDGGFDAVLIGSGDREHPFDQTATNRMYMFRDRGTDSGAVTGTGGSDPTLVESALTDLTSNCIQIAADCGAGQTQSGVQTALAGSSGWFMTLRPGEKSVGGQVTLSGTVFFNTNMPSSDVSAGSCSANLGIARQYQVSALDATATMNNDGVPGLTTADRSFVHSGGGYMPTPVYAIVMFGNKAYEVVLSGLHVSYLPVGVTRNARRMKAWYKEID